MIDEFGFQITLLRTSESMHTCQPQRTLSFARLKNMRLAAGCVLGSSVVLWAQETTLNVVSTASFFLMLL